MNLIQYVILQNYYFNESEIQSEIQYNTEFVLFKNLL